jgi:hypothetical protein
MDDELLNAAGPAPAEATSQPEEKELDDNVSGKMPDSGSTAVDQQANTHANSETSTPQSTPEHARPTANKAATTETSTNDSNKSLSDSAPSQPAASPTASVMLMSSPNNTATPARTVNLSTDSLKSLKDADVKPAFEKLADPDGRLPADKIPELLQELSISHTKQDLKDALGTLSHGATTKFLSLEDTVVCCSVLIGPGSPSSSLNGSKCLSQRRPYMETGRINLQDAVTNYMQKLEDHKKKCEAQGRYPEAQAAAKRLQDLRTQQAAKLRTELVTQQKVEVEQVRWVTELAARRLVMTVMTATVMAQPTPELDVSCTWLVSLRLGKWVVGSQLPGMGLDCCWMVNRDVHHAELATR